MKIPKYETSSGALAAFLVQRPQAAMICDLYTFNLVGSRNGGSPLLYTTLDVDVLVPYASPLTYLASDVQFDQTQNKSYGHCGHVAGNHRAKVAQ